MKAIGRLLLVYFAGSRVTKWLTICGLLLLLASLYVVLYTPQTEHMLALAVPGLILLFCGTSLMPLTLARLAGSHAACILPGARIKLLLSAILTVLLVTLPAGLIAPLAFVAGMSADVSQLFADPNLLNYTLVMAVITYTSACIAAFWLYVLMWVIGNERSVNGVAKALLIFLVLMFMPTADREDPGAMMRANLLQIPVVLLVFSAGFLLWPRIRRALAGRFQARATKSGTTRELAGREIDLVLGNSQPWPLTVALLLPLVVLSRSDEVHASTWLFYLTIASTLSGAMTGQAPERSRALWLRGDWSRPALFEAVEKSAWRHNGRVLMVLFVALLAIGIYAKIPLAIVAVGGPLLILGTVLSTYLGLTLTRGVRWAEATLGVAVMLILMSIAWLMSDPDAHMAWVVGLFLAVSPLPAVFRRVARNRWAHIDWSECRREVQPALRAG
ncbi:MAG: hypothetical protein K0Q92_2784 [Steroidobacteraceae bacterium]|jgi:hypothetical protein|nr:hypothetical protein [Steroidobacteraceae bacterium]